MRKYCICTFLLMAAVVTQFVIAQQAAQVKTVTIPFSIDQLESIKNIKGELTHHSFKGPLSHNQVEYWIYLPEQYAASGKRYPVIYHLHGLVTIESGGWGAEKINDLYEPASAHVIETFEQAVAAGVIEPAILVFPNGYGNTLWSDSKTGNKPAETNFIQELIPYIDANYRTKAGKANRVVQGYSMGGFGAFKFAVKFPELFIAAVNYDGALHSWQSISTRRKAITAEIYGNDPDHFETHAPWQYVESNKDRVRGKVALKANVGSIKEFNRNFRDLLSTNDIAIDYFETRCAHDLACLLQESGQDSFAFIARYIEP